jgi:hypothetical protein
VFVARYGAGQDYNAARAAFQDRREDLLVHPCFLYRGGRLRSSKILLHIVPPDSGYGPPVLGLHLYTWAPVVFCCLILSSALGLLGLSERPIVLPLVLTNGVSALVIILGTVIALATFAIQGFNILLPANPEHYELLCQLGLQ